MLDVLIIGGGVIGASIAHQLSRFKLRLSLLEKKRKIASTINSNDIAIIHDGYAQPYNSLKSRLCFQGRVAFPQLAKSLDLKYKETGSLVLAHNDAEKNELLALLRNGEKIGIEDLELWNSRLILRQVPKINPSVKYALYSKGTGVCSPLSLVNSMMINAVDNGMNLLLNQKVINIESFSKGYRILTNQGKTYKTRYLINAAGAEAGCIAALVGLHSLSLLLPISRQPSVPSVHHSPLEQILLYPPAEVKHEKLLLPTHPHDFIVEQPRNSPNYIHVSGSYSLGVTAAPAIAHRVMGILTDAGLKLQEKFSKKPKEFSPHGYFYSARKMAPLTPIPLSVISQQGAEKQDECILATVTPFSSFANNKEIDFYPRLV